MDNKALGLVFESIVMIERTNISMQTVCLLAICQGENYINPTARCPSVRALVDFRHRTINSRSS